jgi:hypothetical protein
MALLTKCIHKRTHFYQGPQMYGRCAGDVRTLGFFVPLQHQGQAGSLKKSVITHLGGLWDLILDSCQSRDILNLH